MEISVSRGMPEPEAIDTMLVYDAQTGKIVHKHTVVVFPGAEKRSKSDLEARALNMCQKREVDRSHLRVIHIESQAMKEYVEYTVDPVRGTLVEGRRFNHER